MQIQTLYILRRRPQIHEPSRTGLVGHADTDTAKDTQDTDLVITTVSTVSHTQCSGTSSASSPAGESTELDAPTTQHADEHTTSC